MRFASKKILQTHASEKWWNKFYFISLQSSLHCDRSYFKSYIHPIHFFLSLAWGCSQPLKLHFQNLELNRTLFRLLRKEERKGKRVEEINSFLLGHLYGWHLSPTRMYDKLYGSPVVFSRTIPAKGWPAIPRFMQRLFQRRKSCCNHQMLKDHKKGFWGFELFLSLLLSIDCRSFALCWFRVATLSERRQLSRNRWLEVTS